jgi:hypothetical protein
MSDEKNGDDKATIGLTGLILLFLLVLVVQAGIGVLIYCLNPDWVTRGQFGDMFGAVNTLFSGLAFAGLIYAIFLQRKELELQRDELKLTRTELNRPVVTVRVGAFDSGGNVETALDIIVENTGNRPAKNIRLSVDSQVLENALIEKSDDGMKDHVRKVFSERGIIPVLVNGKAVTNSFGWLSGDDQATWKVNQRFDIQVSYEDLSEGKYTYSVPVFIADDAGFAGTHWSDPAQKK